MVYCRSFIYKSVYLHMSIRNNWCKQNASLKPVYRVLWDLSYSFTIPIAYLDDVHYTNEFFKYGLKTVIKILLSDYFISLVNSLSRLKSQMETEHLSTQMTLVSMFLSCPVPHCLRLCISVFVISCWGSDSLLQLFLNEVY